jgi:nucleoid DNA-binding protein
VEDDAVADDGLFSRQDRHQQTTAKFALAELSELVTRKLKTEAFFRLAELEVFHKCKLKARVGRNSATGEQMQKPPKEP